MSCAFAKYKDIIGKPNEGIHGYYRLFDISVFDVVVVIVAGMYIAYVWKFQLWIVLVILFAAGILAHRLFCVRSTIDKWLFP